MSHPALKLLVLYSAQLDQTLAFYKTLGLAFVEEKHGAGPLHYACDTGEMVIEIYPASPASNNETVPAKSTGAVMLGFGVASVDVTLGLLAELGITPKSPPINTAWGRRCVVVDPDGRPIEISESVPQTN
jgi:lactoylglutathione lyase